MFDGYCTSCGAVVLLGPRRIRALRNTTEGIVLEFTCYCGTDGVEVYGREGRAHMAGSSS